MLFTNKKHSDFKYEPQIEWYSSLHREWKASKYILNEYKQIGSWFICWEIFPSCPSTDNDHSHVFVHDVYITYVPLFYF